MHLNHLVLCRGMIVLILILIAALPVQANTYTYDNLNRLVSADCENGYTINYTYDSAGNLLSVSSDLSLQLVNTDPLNDVVDIPTDSIIEMTFNQPIQASTSYADISLTTDGIPVPATTAISGSVLSIMPTSSLENSAIYTVSIPAGAIEATEDSEVSQAYSFSFTTIAQ